MCTRPIPTKPGPMEAGEYALTRGRTCFVERRLEVVEVVGLLWILSSFLARWDFDHYFRLFFFELAHGLVQI